MARKDRLRWDERYAALDRPVRRGPSLFLTRFAPRPQDQPAYALELACGLGENALWLANLGYRVDAFDISGRALRQARRKMLAHSLDGINFVQADLDDFPLPRRGYDLVSVFRFLDRSLFPEIRQRVRPGGLIIYQTMNIRNLTTRPAVSPDHMLELGELPSFFPGWTVLEFIENGRYSSFAGQKPRQG